MSDIALKSKSQWYIPILVWRPLLILSIVIGHSFAIYSGAWDCDFSEIPFIAGYAWVNPLFISFQLQAFFFISGYLFWMKEPICKSISLQEYWNFFRKKLMRLYFPSIVFSLLYLYLFTAKITIIDIFEAFLLGRGHFWFLPTLFWCSVIHRLFAKWGQKYLWLYLSVTFLVIYAGVVLSYLYPCLITALFANIGRYFFFFALGASIHYTKLGEYFRNRGGDSKHIVYGVSFFLAFIIMWCITTFDNWYLIGQGKIEKLLDFVVDPLKALLGVLAMYTFWLHMEQYDYSSKVISFWIYLSSICFGIYVVHQFILIDLVNRHLPLIYSVVGGWFIPFVLLFIAILCSVVIVESFKRVL